MFIGGRPLFLIVLIIAALTIIFSLYYTQINGRAVLTGPVVVTKVIDGDTVIIEGGESVRLLGIDADERGYPCYQPAKRRLEGLVLSRGVYLEADKEDRDQYGRLLRFLFLGGDGEELINVNLRLISEGFAVARFSPDEQKYRPEITSAEKEARENGVGCKWSSDWTSSSAGSGENPAEGAYGGQISEVNWEKLAGNAISACDALEYMGETRIVEGTIVDTYKSRTNTVFLNFGKPYPEQCFTAVIFSSYLKNFENPLLYKGKLARVHGKIKMYEGKPEIILEEGSQIEVPG